MSRKEEIQTKMEQLRTLIELEGLSGIYCKRQDSFSWLTSGGQNYVGLGELGNCGLLVTLHGAYAITNSIEERRMREEEHLDYLGFEIVYGPWHDRDFEKAALAKLCSLDSLALDYNCGFGKNMHAKLIEMRASLSEEELVRYRSLGLSASAILEQVASSINVGDTEKSVVGRAFELLQSHGMDFASMMCASDERIVSYRHPVPTDKRIAKRVQIGGNFRKNGMVVCMTRYVHFAPVSTQLEEQLALNQEIDCIMMAQTIPGRTYSEVLSIAKETYASYGFAEEFEKHHQGGPIGYAPRDYRVDFSHAYKIAQQQAFCWNPSITGTKSEDTIVVSSDGFEFITRPILFPTTTVHVNNTAYTRVAPLQKY